MSVNNTKSIFTRISRLAEVPGNKAAMIRLGIVAASILGVLAMTVCTLPPVTDGLGSFLTAILSGIVCSIMVAAILWGLAKWTAFIFPKAYGVACRCWDNLYAWNLIGLAIKAMLWIYLVMMPVTLYGIILSPLFLLVSALSMIESQLVSRLILILLCVGTLGFMVLLDVCRLKDLCWKQTLRALFSNGHRR